MTDTEWLNTDEAARRLGITTRTLYRFMDQGRLPSYRFGRVFRLKVSDIETFIESCRVEPGSLSHLYPEPTAANEAEDAETGADPMVDPDSSGGSDPVS